MNVISKSVLLVAVAFSGMAFAGGGGGGGGGSSKTKTSNYGGWNMTAKEAQTVANAKNNTSKTKSQSRAGNYDAHGRNQGNNPGNDRASGYHGSGR